MSTVLLVEDDRDLLFLYRVTLNKYGHTIKEASDARIALDLLDDPHYLPDIIFLDINMVVGLSGYGLIEEIRKRPRLNKVEIVVVTANDQYRTQVMEKGVRHFLVKPINILEMVALADRRA